MKAPTVRSLAGELRLSPTTVSDALRGLPRVRAETARRVRQAAAEAGYRLNPLASAVMSEIRRSHGPLFRGTLAAVTLDEPERPAHAGRFFDELVRGAGERARQLGFGLETFTVGARGVTLSRLDLILRSRGIRAVVLLPTLEQPDFSGFDWSRYAGVYTDYIIERPALYAVCSDHHRSIADALERLHALGYRRPGLFLHRRHAERLQFHWEGAFLAAQRRAPRAQFVPLLLRRDFSAGEFTAWFRRHRPDVVLGHDAEAMGWMAACGARIPATHGYFCLNLNALARPCAGLDQQPGLLGARAAEIVVAQLHRNEFGLPPHPTLTSLPARWVDGPTLRRQEREPKAAAPP